MRGAGWVRGRASPSCSCHHARCRRWRRPRQRPPVRWVPEAHPGSRVLRFGKAFPGPGRSPVQGAAAEDALISVQDFLCRRFPSAAAGAGASHAGRAVDSYLLGGRVGNRFESRCFGGRWSKQGAESLPAVVVVGHRHGFWVPQGGGGVGWIPVPGEAGMLPVPFPAGRALPCVGDASPHAAQFISPPALASPPGRGCETLPRPPKGSLQCPAPGSCTIPMG